MFCDKNLLTHHVLSQKVEVFHVLSSLCIFSSYCIPFDYMIISPLLFLHLFLLVVEDEVAREKKEKQEKRKQEKQQKESSFAEVSSSLAGDSQVQTIDLKEINSAELLVDPKISNFANITVDPIRQLCLAADKQVRDSEYKPLKVGNITKFLFFYSTTVPLSLYLYSDKGVTKI